MEIICNRCDDSFDSYEGNFDKIPNNKTGYANYCKECRKKYHRDYRGSDGSKVFIKKRIINLISKDLSDKEAVRIGMIADRMHFKLHNKPKQPKWCKSQERGYMVFYELMEYQEVIE